MNANATEYVPVATQMTLLFATPFFQQRFEKAIYEFFRQDNARLSDLVILADATSAGFIQPIKKQIVGFLASYKGHVLIYETDRFADPRTGYFRRLTKL